MIKVQREDFDIGAELAQLTDGNTKVGGLASFVGLVRDLADQGAVSAMTLEHYPGMTEKRLAEIEAEARARWPLESVLIIHRYGKLEPGDRIVLVATTSSHRQAALEVVRVPDRLAEDQGAVLETGTRQPRARRGSKRRQATTARRRSGSGRRSYPR